ncbi:MAG: peptide chain release factor 1 [Candidatus Omnitrophica bacterium]|nr:peptide chain release factor 1 [Candidatus Omnitrophota bacterium]MBU1127533.1 peptide chain release factor 1 [Candidatus Omnitrophota bacterium]MBU1783953.1 peptide chain release factor 1 [Candidatus Omnitrophota bacterium]MBU1851398.1 peptide chain release factor 1 [Candidatus Omnitrophota bacterium]
MIEELKKKKERYETLEKDLVSPAFLSDREKYKEKAKEYAGLKNIIGEYEKFLGLSQERISLEKMIEEEGKESEYARLAEKELKSVIEALAAKRLDLEELLLDDELTDLKKNVIMEIRAGTGGVEAGLFAADLYKMYARYAARMDWKISVLSLSESEMGGIKEIIFAVEGESVFKHLRFEMGTHRVQRVPETESGGRIHTSAVTVAVLPEAKDIDVEINPQDIRIDLYRSSGAGGQHVNVTDSAVRLTHIPTGIVVICQDERSQHKNKAKAMRVLAARYLEQKETEQREEISEQRKKQVGSGDRSEKIRTYNFSENRVTDHRIKFSLYNLSGILEGALGKLIAALLEEDRKLRLRSG